MVIVFHALTVSVKGFDCIFFFQRTSQPQHTSVKSLPEIRNRLLPTALYVLSSISRTLHNFSTGFCSIYRGILELKSNDSSLLKNGSFPNKTCCFLTALFVKTKIYFCRCNFGNKQINKNSQYRFFVQTVFNRQNPKYSRKCFQFWKWNPKSMGTN